MLNPILTDDREIWNSTLSFLFDLDKMELSVNYLHFGQNNLKIQTYTDSMPFEVCVIRI